MRGGLKFGADYLLYRGRPGKVHAESAALLVDEHEGESAGKRKLTWADVVAKSRLQTTVGKSLLAFPVPKSEAYISRGRSQER